MTLQKYNPKDFHKNLNNKQNFKGNNSKMFDMEGNMEYKEETNLIFEDEEKEVTIKIEKGEKAINRTHEYLSSLMHRGNK